MAHFGIFILLNKQLVHFIHEKLDFYQTAPQSQTLFLQPEQTSLQETCLSRVVLSFSVFSDIFVR